MIWSFLLCRSGAGFAKGQRSQARPLLDELRQWMEKTFRPLSTKSETAGTIRYALSHWRALTRYVDVASQHEPMNASTPLTSRMVLIDIIIH